VSAVSFEGNCDSGLATEEANSMDAEEQVRVLLDLVKYETTTINTLWNFFLTISLGIAGWFAAAGRERLQLLTFRSRMIIAGGYGLFALINAMSLNTHYLIVRSFLTDLQPIWPAAMPDAKSTADAIRPFAAPFLGLPISIVIQIVVGILVCLLILLFGRES